MKEPKKFQKDAGATHGCHPRNKSELSAFWWCMVNHLQPPPIQGQEFILRHYPQPNTRTVVLVHGSRPYNLVLEPRRQLTSTHRWSVHGLSVCFIAVHKCFMSGIIWCLAILRTHKLRRLSVKLYVFCVF